MCTQYCCCLILSSPPQTTGTNPPPTIHYPLYIFFNFVGCCVLSWPTCQYRGSIRSVIRVAPSPGSDLCVWRVFLGVSCFGHDEHHLSSLTFSLASWLCLLSAVVSCIKPTYDAGSLPCASKWYAFLRGPFRHSCRPDAATDTFLVALQWEGAAGGRRHEGLCWRATAAARTCPTVSMTPIGASRCDRERVLRALVGNDRFLDACLYGR